MKVGKCYYIFNNPIRNTNLRLSSLHLAISSGVSSLILLVPGAWLCSQDTNKNINKSNEKNTEILINHTESCWTHVFPVDADYFFMCHEGAVRHRTLAKKLEKDGEIGRLTYIELTKYRRSDL